MKKKIVNRKIYVPIIVEKPVQKKFMAIKKQTGMTATELLAKLIG